jgi:hypothetical protein
VHKLLPGEQTIECDMEFSSIDALYIRFLGKVHTVPDTVVKVKQLSVDGIDMQHFLFTGKFYPNYDENFYKECSPPEYYCPGTEFYHNGVFIMPVTTPIWKYIMEQYNVS